MTAKEKIGRRAFRRLSRWNQRLGLFTPEIDEFAFIIGAMKCGTTTLYEYLVEHPNIHPNLVTKEPEFFSRKAPPKNLNDYYRQWVRSTSERFIALDASTGYAKVPEYPNVAERLRKLEAKKHFIFMVREPVARIESHIIHNIAAGVMNWDYTLDDLQHHISVSSFATQLDAYRSAFPNSKILIHDLSDLATHPDLVVRRTLDHLGLPQHAFEPITPQNTRSSKGSAAKYQLPESLKNQLREKLAPEIQRFGREWGFDISRWGYE